MVAVVLMRVLYFHGLLWDVVMGSTGWVVNVLMSLLMRLILAEGEGQYFDEIFGDMSEGIVEVT